MEIPLNSNIDMVHHSDSLVRTFLVFFWVIISGMPKVNSSCKDWFDELSR